MAAGEVSVSSKLLGRRVGIGDDASQQRPRLPSQAFRHAVAGLAKRDHQHARVISQVVKIIADSEDAALVVEMLLEGMLDARFAQSFEENSARQLACSLSVRHQWAS